MTRKVRAAIFEEMDRWHVIPRDNDDQVCRYGGYDEDPTVMATFPAGDGEMYMSDMQAEAVARAAIEAMRNHTLVFRENGEVVHQLVGAPDDIWKMLLAAALNESPQR